MDPQAFPVVPGPLSQEMSVVDEALADNGSLAGLMSVEGLAAAPASGRALGHGHTANMNILLRKGNFHPGFFERAGDGRMQLM